MTLADTLAAMSREEQRIIPLRVIAQKAFAHGRGLYFWRPSFRSWHVLVPIEV